MGRKRWYFDGERHARVPYDVLMSARFQAAWKRCPAVLLVYVALRSKLWQDAPDKERGTNKFQRDGEIVLVYADELIKPYIAEGTFRKGLKILMEEGFVRRTRRGGLLRVTALYGFDQKWKAPVESGASMSGRTRRRLRGPDGRYLPGTTWQYTAYSPSSGAGGERKEAEIAPAGGGQGALEGESAPAGGTVQRQTVGLAFSKPVTSDMPAGARLLREALSKPGHGVERRPVKGPRP